VTARQYQDAARIALERYYEDVRVEWPIGKDAQDALVAHAARYAARVDVAVGPFNVNPGPDAGLRRERLIDPLQRLFANSQPNRNPRCLLAIEVSFSGTSKHVMGDMLNASAMGLFGLVVGNEGQTRKALRIQEYLTLLVALRKTDLLFPNIVVLSTDQFDQLLADG
jgi:hypothetical protein